MAQYKIDGALLSSEDPHFSEALLQAYSRKIRPLCACKQTDGEEMYLARSGDHVIIKRMPGTGQDHSHDCDSYEPPAELSGRGELQSKAINEDQATGKITLKLDFSLSKALITRTMNAGAGTPPSVAKADPKKLSLRSLFHFMWEEAGLARWTPAMKGKRNWFVIRKHLDMAASKIEAKNYPLNELLLIPEPFKVELKEEIAARRRQFLGKFSKKGNAQPVGILIGELKAIEDARHGSKIVIKHMPDAFLYAGEEVIDRIKKRFETELAMHDEDSSLHTMIAATFILSASGMMQVDSLTLQSCDANWLPFDDRAEFELLERLVSQDRRFIKCLRYNLSADEPIASVLLTDTAEPTAFYINPFDHDKMPAFDVALGRVIEESSFQGHTWHPLRGEVLTLPVIESPKGSTS